MHAFHFLIFLMGIDATAFAYISLFFAFAFPVIAGTHLPTPEGWKVELAWVAGYVMRQFTCPKAVTRPTTNRAQFFIEQLR